MSDANAVREQVLRKLTRAVDLGNGVVRGERQYNDKTFATAYVDLSDDLVARSENLRNFQEELLGEAFFDADGNQRWNSYLYFWAGPNSRKNDAFHHAKALIERDRHYARKFVLDDEDLLRRIDDISRSRPKTAVTGDALARWSRKLREASFEIALEQKPRAQVLRQIESGEAFAVVASTDQRTLADVAPDPLTAGLLRTLSVERFRPICERNFSFGDVNLIVGQNGAGKTSLLELIEGLFCGHVKRDAAARFEGIQATLETPDGNICSVMGNASVATIKARNLAWYGRSDHLSNTISEGFTRFNFLDTDAAFRLATESSAEEIRNNLSRLLVGPETATLWTYLTKLHEDVEAQLHGLDERLPALKAQTELLGAEVKRLHDTPSQSASLFTTFIASVEALGATWKVDKSAVELNGGGRTRLDELLRGLRQVLAGPWGHIGNIHGLRSTAERLTAVEEKIRIHARAESDLKSNLDASRSSETIYSEALSALQLWIRYCQVGAPKIVGDGRRIKSEIQRLGAALASVTTASITDVPPEYRGMALAAAKQQSENALSIGKVHERNAADALGQAEQAAQSIQALKKDLREIAVIVMDRTGDSIHCPLCATAHDQEILLDKLDQIGRGVQEAQNDGLRVALHESRARVEREQRAIAAIHTLERYALSTGVDAQTTIEQLQAKASYDRQVLDQLLLERDQIVASASSLKQMGLDLAAYDQALKLAKEALPVDADAFNIGDVESAVQALTESVKTSQRACADAKERIASNAAEGLKLLSTVAPPSTKTPTMLDAVHVVSRMREQLQASLVFVDEAAASISVPEDKPLDQVALALEDAVACFDRAHHAALSESSARTALGQKIEELQAVTATLSSASSKRERFARAEEALRSARAEYPLEDATREALESIRSQVSYIFERIHSPSEYELGDFAGDSMLVSREDKSPRSANQVSTGQRAALALSIFLSLNQSARRVPPVMLIDDPVAHVDDLNILSFFDYLRDLAVSERKQIFFATADTRVAALFQKKFEFMGERRFRRIGLAR